MKEYCDEFKYESKKYNLKLRQSLLQTLKNKVDDEKSNIKALENQINGIEENIKQLLESTKMKKF